MRYLIIIFLFLTTLVNAQTFTQTGKVFGINNTGVSGIRVMVYKRTTSVTTTTAVRIFSTHNGNGNTSQYTQYPPNVTEMNKLFKDVFIKARQNERIIEMIDYLRLSGEERLEENDIIFNLLFKFEY